MPQVPCPTCKRPVEWNSAARWRPFCSDRCRLIDLGDWLADKHAIPGEPATGVAGIDDPADAAAGTKSGEDLQR